MFKNAYIKATSVRIDSIPPKNVGRTGPGQKQWKEFIAAVFNLPKGFAYHGTLPKELPTKSAFTARMFTAANLYGRVRIACRGNKFWIWPIEKRDFPSRK